MKKLLLLALLFLPVLAFAQDCSGKIQAAQASKAAGNFRKALAQFTAAAGSCGEGRRGEIEKEILDIYDRIERLKNDAESAKKIAATEAEKAKASEKIASEALVDAQNANIKAQAALDSLSIVLDNLGKANADKVRLILAEVERNQQELNFDAAVDKLKTANILRALPDSVAMAYQNLSRALLHHAREDLQRKAYKPALAKIKSAEDLNIQPDSVAVATQALRHFLFENARLDILHTDYDAAAEKINAVSTLSVSPDTVAGVWFEIAFCYTETGRLDRAGGLLDTIAQMRNNDVVRTLLRELEGKEPAQKAQLLRQARQQLDSKRNHSLTARYVPPVSGKIPAGTFALGSDPGDEAQGRCQVSISPYLLGAKEVTFYEYDLFCAATNRPKPSDNGWGRGQRPTIDVDWYDAVEYCNWRSHQEGLQEVYAIDKGPGNPNDRDTSAIRNWQVACNWSANGYRLPTEVEWEFAAGNGERHTRFSWGNELPTAQQGGNVTDETAKAKFPDWEIFAGYSDGFAYTAPAGSYQPNHFGLYDMTGNVWEWCWDWYDENYCRANKSRNAPQGPASGDERVLRSGSWGSFPKDCFVSNRFHDKPDTRNYSIGFRLARNSY